MTVRSIFNKTSSFLSRQWSIDRVQLIRCLSLYWFVSVVEGAGWPKVEDRFNSSVS